VLIDGGIDVKSYYIKSNPRAVDAMGDLNENDIEVFLGNIKNLNPDLVGFSLKSPIFHMGKYITKKIKTLLPNVKIIWGGVHPSLLPEESIKYSDFVCVGEGEEAILELVEKLSNGEKGNDVQNIWAKEKDFIYKSSQRPIVKDLDTLPLPKFNDKKQFYISDGKTTNAYSLPEWTVMSSRGCPYKCWYCSNEIIDEVYKRGALRRRTVDNVIDELLLVKSKLTSIKIIYFGDDVFTISKKWIEEFAPKYKKQIGIPFAVQTYPSFVNNEVINLLKEAGLCAAMIGIQSGSERVRKEIYFRKTSDKQILNAVEILKNHNIPYSRYDFIHNNPYETREDKVSTLNLLLKFPRPFGLNIFQLLWYPKTKLTEKALKEGVISQQTVEGNCHRTLAFQRSSGSVNYQEDIYFANLYYLAGSNYFPKILVRFFSNYHLFERYQIIINAVIFFTKFLKALFFGFHGLIKVLQGKGSKETILGGVEMLSRFILPKRYDH
jgi:radical SAM superfamily enzyme YgiQ (UPF0313 family)